MEAFLAELRQAGRALVDRAARHDASRRAGSRPRRKSLYRSAFRRLVGPRPTRLVRSIVRRFLQTHALIGLADLTARYPIAPVEAAELLERWSEEGKVVRVGDRRCARTGAVGGAGKPGRDAPGDRGGAAAREPGGCPGGLRRFPAAAPARSSGDAGRRSGVRRGRSWNNCRGSPRRRRCGKMRSCPGGSKATGRPGSTTCSARGPGSGVPSGTARDDPRVAFFPPRLRGTSRRASPRVGRALGGLSRS